jgi:hypothetical protein
MKPTGRARGNFKKLREARTVYEKALARAKAEYCKTTDAAWQLFKAAGNKYGDWRMK